MISVKSQPNLLDVRQAAKSAMEYSQALFPTAINFSLEEAELSEDEKYWLITLGFETPNGKPKVAKSNHINLESLLLGGPKAKYKIFKVDATTGKVVSMKIRAME
ncbi:MAG TPA: hypothetical protein VH413_14580 [Verrucomicrobiae bacterium]|jgi:hypothetical protein|nr:hypothetical protein [Verrucomicrobiae bacterium]